jgi:hypothetical protein
MGVTPISTHFVLFPMYVVNSSIYIRAYEGKGVLFDLLVPSAYYPCVYKLLPSLPCKLLQAQWGPCAVCLWVSL